MMSQQKLSGRERKYRVNRKNQPVARGKRNRCVEKYLEPSKGPTIQSASQNCQMIELCVIYVINAVRVCTWQKSNVKSWSVADTYGIQINVASLFLPVSPLILARHLISSDF